MEILAHLVTTTRECCCPGYGLPGGKPTAGPTEQSMGIHSKCTAQGARKRTTQNAIHTGHTATPPTRRSQSCQGIHASCGGAIMSYSCAHSTPTVSHPLENLSGPTIAKLRRRRMNRRRTQSASETNDKRAERRDAECKERLRRTATNERTNGRTKTQ